MLGKLGPILLVVASSIIYQLAQRVVSPAVNSFLLFALVYLLGFILCVALISVSGRPIGFADVHILRTWPPWILGISVVGIEVGYLLAYRAGWPLGTAVGVTYTLTIVLLALTGAMFLSEELSLRRIAGLLFGLTGLWLLIEPSRAP